MQDAHGAPSEKQKKDMTDSAAPGWSACEEWCELEGTVVVGEDEAPLGGDAEHRAGLVKGKLVGATGAPRLARQLEGWHMVRIHPVV